MEAPNCPVLYTGRDSTRFVVRVVGRGTLRESPTLLAFGQQCLADADALLVVDLCDCEYLDSSFLGTLVALHRHGLPQTRFRLWADPPVRQRLLEPARLDRLFAVHCPPAERTAIPLCALPVAEMSLEQTARHALAAHRRLAQLEGEFAVSCGQVADRLEQELGTVDGHE